MLALSRSQASQPYPLRQNASHYQLKTTTALPIQFGFKGLGQVLKTSLGKSLPGNDKPIGLFFDLDESLVKWRSYNKTLNKREFNAVKKIIADNQDKVFTAINTSRSLKAVQDLSCFIDGMILDYLIVDDGQAIFINWDREKAEEWLPKLSETNLDPKYAPDAAWKTEVNWPKQDIMRLFRKTLQRNGFKDIKMSAEDKKILGEMEVFMANKDGLQILSLKDDMQNYLLYSPDPNQSDDLHRKMKELNQKTLGAISRSKDIPVICPEIQCKGNAKGLLVAEYYWAAPAPWNRNFYVFGPKHPTCNKAEGIKAIVQSLDNVKHVSAIGDSGNDKEPIEHPVYENHQGVTVNSHPIFHWNPNSKSSHDISIKLFDDAVEARRPYSIINVVAPRYESTANIKYPPKSTFTTGVYTKAFYAKRHRLGFKTQPNLPAALKDTLAKLQEKMKYAPAIVVQFAGLHLQRGLQAIEQLAPQKTPTQRLAYSA